jgi:hypothetical protein
MKKMLATGAKSATSTSVPPLQWYVVVLPPAQFCRCAGFCAGECPCLLLLVCFYLVPHMCVLPCLHFAFACSPVCILLLCIAVFVRYMNQVDVVPR